MTQETASEIAGLHAKHLQRVERGTSNVTIATLTALSLAYGVSLEALFSPEPPVLPFRVLEESEAQPFVNCVPFYSLRAAAGAFGKPQEIEPEHSPQAWVAPASKARISSGMFVAQVQGESMSRRIPNGAYCLFRASGRRPRSGQVWLVQHRLVRDSDRGGRFTVKVFRERSDGTVSLDPDSIAPGHASIRLPAAEDVTAIAELVEVLPSPT